MRRSLTAIETEKDASGRVERAWACVSPAQSGASDDPPGFLFRGHDFAFSPGETYTLDADPNDYLWLLGRQGGARTAGGRAERPLRSPARRRRGRGVVATGRHRRTGSLHGRSASACPTRGFGIDFEPSKTAFIGTLGDAPLLLVQGPPGTGKSFTTAFAVLARMQGAWRQACRFGSSWVPRPTPPPTSCCKTSLRPEIYLTLKESQPELFAYLLRRATSRGPALPPAAARRSSPAGVIAVYAKQRRDKSQPRPFELFKAHHSSHRRLHTRWRLQRCQRTGQSDV